MTENMDKDTLIMEMISVNVICRLCANQSDKLLGLYSEEGIASDIANKVNLYLPIKVTVHDDLPLQCCLKCASILLSWHDLVITCIESDQRLRSYQFITEKQLEDIQCRTDIITSAVEEKNVEGHTAVDRDPLETKSGEPLPLNEVFIKENQQDSKPIEYNEFDAAQTAFDSFVHNNSPTMELPVQDKHENVLPEITVSNHPEAQNVALFNFECEYCQTVFITELDIITHMKKAHADEFDFEGLQNEKDPADTSTLDEKPHLSPSKESKKRPAKKEKRIFHRYDHDMVNAAKLVVEGRVYYNCKQCGKNLHSPYTYAWHVRIHTGERPYSCTLCGKRFRVSQGLLRHLKETHEKVKNYACDLCEKSFTTKRNVEEHRRIHTNERPYVCALCGKAFKQKASLFVHKRTHTDNYPFKCSYCTQAFRTRTNLSIHMRRHTGEKPFSCDDCGRNFRIKYELKRHRLIHSDEKPFSCEICNAGFRQKRYLKNHFRLNHAGAVVNGT